MSDRLAEIKKMGKKTLLKLAMNKSSTNYDRMYSVIFLREDDKKILQILSITEEIESKRGYHFNRDLLISYLLEINYQKYLYIVESEISKSNKKHYNNSMKIIKAKDEVFFKKLSFEQNESIDIIVRNIIYNIATSTKSNVERAIQIRSLKGKVKQHPMAYAVAMEYLENKNTNIKAASIVALSGCIDLKHLKKMYLDQCNKKILNAIVENMTVCYDDGVKKELASILKNNTDLYFETIEQVQNRLENKKES